MNMKHIMSMSPIYGTQVRMSKNFDFSSVFDPFGIFETKTTDPSVQRVATLSPEQDAILQNLNFQQRALLDRPGPQFPGDIVPQPGPLSQELQGLAGPLMGQSAEALGQGLAPLTAQGIQQGSQPFLDAMMGQFQGQVVPEIAGQFGALDSARSSGMANVLGRAGAQLPGMAQNMFMQGRQQQLQGGLAGLGLGGNIAQDQDRLAQLFQQGQLQNWQMGLPGADPRTRNLSLALGIPAFGNIGMPGSQEPSMFSQIAPAIGPAMMMMSDIRMKENIKPIDNALDKVARLSGSTYNYKSNSLENRNGGVMAQDLETILPDAVSEIDSVKFVKYDAVIGLLVNAVNELRQEIRSA